MPLVQPSSAIINVVVIKLITILFLSSLRHGVVNCVELAPFTFSTTSGVLQGLQLDVGTRKVNQLLGVPYAKPPLGSLRYMKPVEYTSADNNINTAYDATYQRPMCIQFLKLADAGVPEFMRPRTGQSEDCLYMDIYIGFDRRLPPSGASTRPAYEPPRENTRPAAVSGPLPINFSGHQPLPQNSTPFVRPYNPSSSSPSVDSFGNVIPRAIRDYFDGQRQTNLLGARSAALQQQPRGGDTGSKLKPIMVFFHGGGFVFGSGSMYNASFLALGGDVIVVVPNYRLGPLGFLSFASDELPGNAGLWDQHFVLQWVRANALALGGDPNRVTIFGESSGAMSTSAHCLSPMSKIPDALGSGTLFRRAIMQSGIITNNLVEHNPERIRAKAESFANALQCARGAAPADGGGGVSTSTLLLLECLQQVSVRQIRDVGRHSAYNFGIVVDGLFLPADPERMLREGRFHKEIDLLIGFNSDEGSVALANIRSDFELPDTNFEQAVANTLRSTVLRPYYTASSTSATDRGDAASSAAAARAIESIAADLIAYEYFGDHADLIEQISAEMHRRGQALNSLGTILGDATDTVYSAGAGLVEADGMVGRGTLHGGETTSDVLVGLDRRGFGRTLFPSPDIAAKKQQHVFNTSLTSLEVQTLRNLRRLMDITKDSLIEAPAVRFANMVANRGALAYMYVFSHEPTFEFLRKPPYLVRGAAHAEELPFLFGMVLRDFAATDAEQLLSVLMIDAWTNFAKFGNPAFSPDIAPNLPDWLPWRTNSAREHYFLDFDVNVRPSSLKQNVNSRKHYLWNDLLPRFMAAMSDCASGNAQPTIIVENSPASVPIFLPTSATGGSRHFFDGEQPQNSASSKHAVADIGRQLHARSNEQQIATYFEHERKDTTNLPDSVRNGNFSTTLKPSVTTTVHVTSIMRNATTTSTTPAPPAASTNAPNHNNNNSVDPSSSSVITCVQNFTLPDPLHVSPPPTSSLFSGGLFLVGRYVTVAQADLLVCGLCVLLIVTVLSAVIVALLWCCCWECGALTRSQCNKNQKLLLLESQNNDNNLHRHHQQCRHLHECSANRHSNLTSSTMIAAFGGGGGGEPPPLPKINKRPFGIRTVPIVTSASGESHKNRSASNITSSEWCGTVSAVKKRYPWM